MRGIGLIGGMTNAIANFIAMQMATAEREVRQSGSRRKTTRHTPNGKRECARRRRQIAAGSLRVENGLSLCC
jgi:hypothetical protein